MLFRGWLVMGFLAFLTSCAGGIQGDKYKDQTPAFDLKSYFTGPIQAWGIIQDRSGNVVSRFDVKMVGTWEGDVGTLKEDFVYYGSNETQQRIWTITKTGKNAYQGKASDIIGVATGKESGSSMQWTYEMDVPVEGKTYRLKFDDWMWAMNDGVVVNRSYLKKYGVTVAEITIFMKKQ